MAAPKNAPVSIDLALLLCGAAYMAPYWVLGSLVSIWNKMYGPTFYTMMSASFVGSGLPISLLQKWLDKKYDEEHGSITAVKVRGVLLYILIGASTFLFAASKPQTVRLLAMISVGFWFVDARRRPPPASSPPALAAPFR